MTEYEYEEKPAINVTTISHVSCHGKGFYLYVPKDAAKVYKIFPGDRVEVTLGRHWKPNLQKIVPKKAGSKHNKKEAKSLKGEPIIMGDVAVEPENLF